MAPWYHGQIYDVVLLSRASLCKFSFGGSNTNLILNCLIRSDILHRTYSHGYVLFWFRFPCFCSTCLRPSFPVFLLVNSFPPVFINYLVCLLLFKPCVLPLLLSSGIDVDIAFVACVSPACGFIIKRTLFISTPVLCAFHNYTWHLFYDGVLVPC